MSAQELATAPAAARAAGRGRVEVHGVDIIPDDERRSTPRDFFWIWPSAQFSLGTVVLGSLPVIFGLSWWGSVSAILVGLAVGTLMFAPIVRFGIRTGTNDPVSSGAHFGVRGRVIGNLITIIVGIGFFSIAVWTGGTAVMVASNRLLGTPTGTGALAVTMPLVGTAVILIAVFGHDMLIATYKLTTVIGGAVLVAMVIVAWNRFDPGYGGGAYALDGFWPTWLLAASASASVALSYVTFQGDYSRYMPERTNDRKLLLLNGIAMFVSCALALGAGAYITTVFADKSVPWVQALTDVVPGWFVVIVILFGVVGTFSQGALCMYAAGLSANSIFWRTSRAVVTIVVSVAAMITLFLGAIVFDAIDSMAAFVSLLLAMVAPWAAIMIVGFRKHRGRYQREDLHAFALPGGGGSYWYVGGVSLCAVAAFVPAVVVGLLLVNSSLYVGPLSTMVGGVDLSFLGSFVVAAVSYLVLGRILPQRLGGFA